MIKLRIIKELYSLPNASFCNENPPALKISSGNRNVVVGNGGYYKITINAPFGGICKVSGGKYHVEEEVGQGSDIDFTLEIKCVVPPKPVVVTTNAEAGATIFTKAWFTMPAHNVTTNYTLVRKLNDTEKPVTFDGIPTSDVTVKKGGDGKYQPATPPTIKLNDEFISGNDKNIINADGIKITVEKKGESDTWTPLTGTLDDFLADMQPGIYHIKAEPKDETSSYVGTVISDAFTAVGKYDLTVQPADEYSKDKLKEVTIDNVVQTIDATTGKVNVEGIDATPAKEVKLTAETGYIMTAVSATNINQVTISEDKTEASFTIPQSDVTATYTIKRDMTVAVNYTIASGIRIENDGSSFKPVDANAIWPTITDDLVEGSSVPMTKDTHYTLQLQKQGDTEDDWTDVTAYSVGTFRYKITGTGNYSGVIYTNNFKLFEGYEVSVPAGEYVTFYAAENLKVEDTDAKLYTITAVDETAATATLSDPITVAPSTPLLVYNSNSAEKKFLLLPTEETADNVAAATEFKGTLTATQIAASTTTKNNYAFNGLKFVWVKNVFSIGANKCWLEIGTPASARTVKLVFGDTTGIDGVERTEQADGDWYDLNGRKLQAAPKRKGVYIHNGRKEMVK